MASDNVWSAGNQQERPRLHPWYVVGFVDGEGSFHVAFYRDERMKTIVKAIPEFHVSQQGTSRSVLEDLQMFFGAGHIRENHRGDRTDRTHVLVIRDRSDLLRTVIPFFEQHALQTVKRKDFETFAIVVRLMERGVHRTVDGMRRIISLAYTMNDGGRRRSTPRDTLMAVVESSETIRRNNGGR